MKKLLILLSIMFTIIQPIRVFAAPQESMEEKSIEEYKAEAIERVIATAKAEIGYLEKGSNNSLYDFKENAGHSNYTKYGYDLGKNGFYEGSLNGLAWCDQFVDWCFCKTFGVQNSKKITGQIPYGSAACSYSMELYRAAGQLYNEPQPGDQVFFGNHTGFVYAVDDDTIYTIEGNTTARNGVVSEGDGVAAKSYSKNSGRIVGYGRPDYEFIAQLDQYTDKLKKLEEERQRIEQLRKSLMDKTLLQ